MRTTNSADIIQRIDYARKRKGTMVQELCDACGLSRQCFKNWRTRGTIPQADDLWNMADYLDVDPEWLLFGETKQMTAEQAELLLLMKGVKPEVFEAVKKMLKAFQE